MSADYIRLGKRIHMIRKRRGLSQMALAEEIECSPTFISYIESGKKCMSLDMFISIANALHVSSDDLLYDSLENTVIASNHELSTLLSDCSEYEKRVLIHTSNEVKKAMRENRSYL